MTSCIKKGIREVFGAFGGLGLGSSTGEVMIVE